MLFSIETHITCDFSGGGGGGPDPLSPYLDLHMATLAVVSKVNLDLRNLFIAIVSLG